MTIILFNHLRISKLLLEIDRSVKELCIKKHKKSGANDPLYTIFNTFYSHT